jgi:pyruvate formate lyase activating enzyme
MSNITVGKQRTPLILDVKGNSLDDGPGIRTVVFFKGCPLSCAWCHNPESKGAAQDISFDSRECIGCGTCLSLCPRGALSKKNPFYIDRNRCDLCFTCVNECPSGALARVGKEMTVEEIAGKVLLDKPFFDTSGGGVTLSGGEPTLHMSFASRLLELLNTRGIHTLLETCGLFDSDAFINEMYPYLDAIYFDIKLIDDVAHRRYCGVSNTKILGNLSMLIELTAGDGVSFLPRVPLIPDITDTAENIEGIARFLTGRSVKKAAFLTYNPLWPEKNVKIGAENTLKADSVIRTWPARERLARARDIFTTAGIEVI